MRPVHAVALVLLFAVSSLVGQTNPVPLIYQPLHPASIEPGHESFTLTVHGTGFVSGATIMADLIPLATTFVSSTEVRTRVPAGFVAKPRTAAITVKNPGSIASNVVYFTVRDSSPTVRMSVGAHVSVGNAGATVAGDFNGDGKADVAVGRENDDHSGWTISIYFGNGRGGFGHPTQTVLTNGFEHDYSFHGMIAADVNNDGMPDLAVQVYYNYVCYCGCPTTAILLNNGDGTFSDRLASDHNPYILFTSFADVNGDGKLDAFDISTCADGTPPSYGVNLGNGDGTFGQPLAMRPTQEFSYVGFGAFGDFNADGIVDLAVPGGTDRETVIGILLGEGDGTFTPPTFFQTPYGGTQVFVADLNGDEVLDLVGDDACVLLGQGNGMFLPSSNCSDSRTLFPAAITDFNGDGKLDFLSMTVFGNFDIWLGNGDGSFQQPLLFASQAGYNGSLFESGNPLCDTNNDGMLDFVKPGYRVIVGQQKR